MCIRNSEKMRLETAKNDFFKISNNLEQNNNSKKTEKAVTKNLQSVFYESTFFVDINSPLSIHENIWLPLEIPNIRNASHLSPEQPPDLIVA